MRRLVVGLALLLASLLAPRGAVASTDCATAPDPASVEEMAAMLRNMQNRGRRRTAGKAEEPALLALSDGGLRIAYAAGLLGGWAETGERPDFAVVTAVGRSALLAPFAFIGSAADRELAHVVTCSEAGDWRGLVQDVADLLQPALIEVMARRHRAGARLIVVVPGSPARPESVWDMGAIAASHGLAARSVFIEILIAAVDIGYAPRAVGGTPVERNMVFRQLGSGEAFAWPRETRMHFDSITLVHSAVLFGDESDDFLETQGRRAKAAPHWLMPAAAFAAESRASGARFRFATIKPKLNLPQSGAAFDLAYARALYLHAYRHGRMNTAWRSSLPSGRHP